MAVRTYYGTCTTESDVSEKKVYVPDTDLIEQDFNFQEGDLLGVFFAQTNTVSEPSIVIYNQDPEIETSTTNDTGKYIKSLDVEANMENAWAAGETVIFAYTQQGTTGTYYWELIDANHASIETYGDTKLFDEEKLEELLTDTEKKEENSKIALTPNALKKFFELLQGKAKESEDDSQSVPEIKPVIGLNWIPAIEEPEQKLGSLSLSGDGEEDGIDITYPIDARIAEYASENGLIRITHTGQLTNNGNGGGEGHEIDASEPFITRIIPDNLYFGNGQGIFYGNPTNNPTTGIVLNNNDVLSIKGTNGIALNSPTNINGATRITGALTTTGVINASNAQISTSGPIKGNILYEGFTGGNTGTALKYKYNSILETHSVKSPTHEISANTSVSHYKLNMYKSNLEFLGIVGYNMSYDSTKGKNTDVVLCNVWECCKNGNDAQYGIRNMWDRKVYITMTIFGLYRRII